MKSTKYVALGDAERSEIEILLGRGCSLREIARVLGRSPNTISREIKVNSVGGQYLARKAKPKSRLSRRSRRFQWRKIEQYPALRLFVIQSLKDGWNPDEIAGYLKYRQDELPSVSKSQLYAWLRSSRGQQYCCYLASRRYRVRRRPPVAAKKVLIPDRVSITERPAGATNRTRYGHWEGDCIVSSKRSGSKVALAVFVERRSRYLQAMLIPDLKPESFTTAAVSCLRGKKARSLTLDNGIETRDHRTIAKATGARTFFCDPYSSWQKGSVEQANGLIRQYIPKGSDLNNFDQAYVESVVDRLNRKPRRCLGYYSALELAEEKGLL